MLISEAINKLGEIFTKHGDLQIVGGYLNDDTPPTNIIVIDEKGCDIIHGYTHVNEHGEDVPNKIDGVFIE